MKPFNDPRVTDDDYVDRPRQLNWSVATKMVGIGVESTVRKLEATE